MKKFRKKPVVIEAIQFTGENSKECMEFCPVAKISEGPMADLIIRTIEGDYLCTVGDWIIKDANGDFFPCKPDPFEGAYEPIDTPVEPVNPAAEATADQDLRLICVGTATRLNPRRNELIETAEQIYKFVRGS